MHQYRQSIDSKVVSHLRTMQMRTPIREPIVKGEETCQDASKQAGTFYLYCVFIKNCIIISSPPSINACNLTNNFYLIDNKWRPAAERLFQLLKFHALLLDDSQKTLNRISISSPSFHDSKVPFWQKRVSLSSVSPTNYDVMDHPTGHEVQREIEFYPCILSAQLTRMIFQGDGWCGILIYNNCVYILTIFLGK